MLFRKIPWAEEPGGLQSMGSLTVRHDWATSLSFFPFMHWRRKWQPTPVFLAWRIPGMGEPHGLRSMGSHRVRHNWSDLAAAAAALFLLHVHKGILVQMLSRVQLFATSWTMAHQAPLSIGFTRQEYWRGLPLPSLGDLPDPGMELMSLALADGFLTTNATWEAPRIFLFVFVYCYC